MTNVGEVDGLTLFPADAGYRAAVEVFNLAAPVRPAAAVTARTVGQVRAAILDARRRGWHVRVHSTGHGSACTCISFDLMAEPSRRYGVRAPSNHIVAAVSLLYAALRRSGTP